MKFSKTVLAFVFAVIAYSATAQTADDIVNNYVAAMGGAEKLTSLKTVKMEGSMSTQGIDVPLTMTKKHLTGMRLDLDIMGTANFQLATPAKGWVFMPIMQHTEPQEMDAEQLKSVQSQLDIQGALFNYKEKGYTLEIVGTEKVGDKDCHKLKIVRGGKEVLFFVDIASGLLLKTVSKVTALGNEMEVATTYTDYRKNADGYMFAYSTTNTQGVITFDKISTNLPVDDKLFTN